MPAAMSKVIKSGDPGSGAYASYERNALDPPSGRQELGDPSAAANRIVAAARAEAEKKLQEAYEEGLRRGTEEGRAQFEATLAECREALQNAAQAMARARDEFLASLEPQVAALAVAVAERIIGREARTDPELVVRTVRAALEHLVDREGMVVHLHPDDLAALKQHEVDLLDRLEGVKELEMIPDETVVPGGCIIDTGAVRVDAAVDAQLQSILDALLE